MEKIEIVKEQDDDDVLNNGNNNNHQNNKINKSCFFLLKSYYYLFLENKSFTFLWIANLISLLGDWLNELACLTLLGLYEEKDQTSLFIGLFLISREVAPLIWQPIVGVVIDSFDRIKIMIIADLTRMIFVLGYIFVSSKKTLWMIYVLQFLQYTLTSFFLPCSEAILPSLVKKEQLILANTILSITWSTMLMIGAGIGGIITYKFGTTIDFLCDSSSYLLSSLFIFLLSRYSHKQNFKSN
jgi:MFS family permease